LHLETREEEEERSLIVDLKRHTQHAVARVSSPQVDLSRYGLDKTPTLLILHCRRVSRRGRRCGGGVGVVGRCLVYTVPLSWSFSRSAVTEFSPPAIKNVALMNPPHQEEEEEEEEEEALFSTRNMRTCAN
jgi:hypothetical protein